MQAADKESNNQRIEALLGRGCNFGVQFYFCQSCVHFHVTH